MRSRSCRNSSISIHAPAKGATLVLASFIICCSYFNPRSREGSDSIFYCWLLFFWQFQSTLPRRERRSDGLRVIGRGDFNPRSREGSDPWSAWPCRPRSNFNPRSREGSDPAQAQGIVRRIISIHAPAKGATLKSADRSRRHAISIHAPAKGATRQSARCLDISNDFNPRSREGSDGYHRFPGRHADHFNPRSREGSDRVIWRHPKGIYISIHAPAKGATQPVSAMEQLYIFQSTLPRRERLILYSVKSTFAEFQSTLPRRERHQDCDAAFRAVKFQSTLPRRERP